ncbi:MAG: biotin--[acetyl-CoA-carboxylase] ligase [Coriobacteriia bacterium]|nr:biotin--[acetyl-CoA-carboxylase] ligase [Coriobacteriia bacterium]
MTNNQEYELLRFASLSSTNDYLKNHLDMGIGQRDLPVFVLAEEQSSGRGRLGRSWHSPKGGIYLSLLWPRPLPLQVAQSLPLIVAVAVRQALQPLSEQLIKLKWPNDLVVEDGAIRSKLVGILVELVNEKAIIGIGVNVFSDGNSAGLDNAYLINGSINTDPKGLYDQSVEQLIKCLLDCLGLWEGQGFSFEPFREEYQQYLTQLGEYVEVSNAFGELVAAGTIEGIDNNGLLMLSNDEGMQKVVSGEVTLRKNV